MIFTPRKLSQIKENIKNNLKLIRDGRPQFFPDFRLFSFFCIFRVENIAFSSANSHLISSLKVFFSFPVPIPDACIFFLPY